MLMGLGFAARCRGLKSLNVLEVSYNKTLPAQPKRQDHRKYKHTGSLVPAKILHAGLGNW